MGEIDRLLAELRDDPAKLAKFADAELGDLRKKIPAELKGGDGPDLGSNAYLLELLEQVRPLLGAQFQSAKGVR